MTTTTATEEKASTSQNWYGLPEEKVADSLGVDPAKGLTASEAASRLAKNGPDQLPPEKPTPGWQRFLNQYRNYMQLILLAAAVMSPPDWAVQSPRSSSR